MMLRRRILFSLLLALSSVGLDARGQGGGCLKASARLGCALVTAPFRIGYVLVTAPFRMMNTCFQSTCKGLQLSALSTASLSLYHRFFGPRFELADQMDAEMAKMTADLQKMEADFQAAIPEMEKAAEEQSKKMYWPAEGEYLSLAEGTVQIPRLQEDPSYTIDLAAGGQEVVDSAAYLAANPNAALVQPGFRLHTPADAHKYHMTLGADTSLLKHAGTMGLHALLDNKLYSEATRYYTDVLTTAITEHVDEFIAAAKGTEERNRGSFLARAFATKPLHRFTRYYAFPEVFSFRMLPFMRVPVVPVPHFFDIKERYAKRGLKSLKEFLPSSKRYIAAFFTLTAMQEAALIACNESVHAHARLLDIPKTIFNDRVWSSRTESHLYFSLSDVLGFGLFAANRAPNIPPASWMYRLPGVRSMLSYADLFVGMQVGGWFQFLTGNFKFIGLKRLLGSLCFLHGQRAFFADECCAHLNNKQTVAQLLAVATAFKAGAKTADDVRAAVAERLLKPVQQSKWTQLKNNLFLKTEWLIAPYMLMKHYFGQ